MPEFNRYDICEAWWVYAHDFGPYHTGRNTDIITRLRHGRARFKPAPGLKYYRNLTDNGRDIYDGLVNHGPHTKH